MLAIYIVMFYNRLLNDPKYDPVPRQFIFAAKAAPGYYMAKLIIRFIHGIAGVVNSNPKTRGKLSVAFLPDYRVSLAEKIMPASEVSEQISLAGMEASGTGNMKFMMNGALTLGTYDGANVEIHREVGDENMFLFGLRTEDVAKLRPTYVSKDWYAKDPEIKAALDMIKANVFSLLEPGLFEPILRSLLDYNDYYMLLADLVPRREEVEPHVARQRRAFGFLLVRPLRDGVRSRHLARQPRKALTACSAGCCLTDGRCRSWDTGPCAFPPSTAAMRTAGRKAATPSLR